VTRAVPGRVAAVLSTATSHALGTVVEEDVQRDVVIMLVTAVVQATPQVREPWQYTSIVLAQPPCDMGRSSMPKQTAPSAADTGASAVYCMKIEAVN
jgi:hypothetical protein